MKIIKKYRFYIALFVLAVVLENFGTPLQKLGFCLIFCVVYLVWKFIEGLCTPDR